MIDTRAAVTQTDEELPDVGTTRYRCHREALLDKVVDHLLDHGLREVSIPALGTAIGVSDATLQHYFATTDELLGEVFSALRVREDISAPTSAEDAEQLIRDLWRRWSSPQREGHFRLLFEVFGHALRDPEHYSAFLDGIVSDWITAIEFFAVQLGYTPKDASLVATSVLAQLRGLQLDLLTTGDHERTAAALDMFLAQFTRAAPVSGGCEPVVSGES
ncbi:transcriptional regulator, TetR family [Mycolicibacterium canariasense]|uniref:Transcriptional regulator, TetR family n=1 Tax=Mycolicibacterium canariasense TaxID=228230 RepID=A0A100WDR6_MYCCR|nr:transcriptional regulator, TetR family [Mycolicibacterium canariasense]